MVYITFVCHHDIMGLMMWTLPNTFRSCWKFIRLPLHSDKFVKGANFHNCFEISTFHWSLF